MGRNWGDGIIDLTLDSETEPNNASHPSTTTSLPLGIPPPSLTSDAVQPTRPIYATWSASPNNATRESHASDNSNTLGSINQTYYAPHVKKWQYEDLTQTSIPDRGYSNDGVLSWGRETKRRKLLPQDAQVHVTEQTSSVASLNQVPDNTRRMDLAPEHLSTQHMQPSPSWRGRVSSLTANASRAPTQRLADGILGLSSTRDLATVTSDLNLTDVPVRHARSSGQESSAFPKPAPPQSGPFCVSEVPAFMPDQDSDSVISDVSPPTRVSAHPAVGQTVHSQVSLPYMSTSPPRRPPSRPIAPGQFSEEEEHFLIFLKEVKQMKWRDITSTFSAHYPGRSYHHLQNRYSAKINKRDRSQDPRALKLPPQWTAEAVIDWPNVHATTSGPRERHILADLHHVSGADSSSGQEFGSRKQRARRAPPVNYTWPRQRRGDAEFDTDEDGIEGILPYDAGHAVNEPSRSASPDNFGQVSVITLDVNEVPIDVDFDRRDASLALSAERYKNVQVLPYLTSIQRHAMKAQNDTWQWHQPSIRELRSAVLHVDFSPTEMHVVEKAIRKLGKSTHTTRHTTQNRHLRAVLRDTTDPHLKELAYHVSRQLPMRDSKSAEAFLLDAKSGKLAESSRIHRLALAKPIKSSNTCMRSTTTILREREYGLQARRGWQAASKPITYQVNNKIMDTMGPALSWTGASSDIHTVAWSKDGETFAAGAVAVTDADSMQYNRSNNLLYGVLSTKVIHELGEHSKIRERTETGANSTRAMFVSQDPKLYTTVTSVAFSPTGKLMYSSGYDESVCVWRLHSDSQPTFATKLIHKAEVEMMAVNRTSEGLLATAVKKASKSTIKLLRIDEDNPTSYSRHNFYSEKAVSRSDLRIYPQALQLEPTSGYLLLAGFGANARDDGLDNTGDLCVWDTETQTQIPIRGNGSSRNIFDVTFNLNRTCMPTFAAGCVAGGNVNRGTRSLLCLYDWNRLNTFSLAYELECKAADMNDIAWCPHDEYLISVGCTDGRVYVWDLRWPDDPLRTLSHGRSLMPLQEGMRAEEVDTGVRFLSWGQNATRLYSGSSDGVVRVWDVTKSQEDSYVKDLAIFDSGVMAGAFSPDYTKLVVGEVNGSVNVLDVGRSDCTLKDMEKLRYIPYAGRPIDDSFSDQSMNTSTLGSAIYESNSMLQSGELQIVPMGNLPGRQVVQGPSYAGPFDQSIDAPFLREQALQFQLSMAANPGPQCAIPACEESFSKVTSEEGGDSGRSADRIPDELRRQWTAIDDAPRIIPGKSKCTSCGRPARPVFSDTEDQIQSVLCERCSFACLRCGATIPIAPATAKLICDFCTGVWEIGSLGYECVEQPALSGSKLDVPSLRRYGRDRLEERFEEDVTYGDEMNALTEYYFSLAIDRPESPPL